MIENDKPDVWHRLIPILHEERWIDIIYVYRVGPDDRPVSPYLVKHEPFRGFLEWLRETYGRGGYHLKIRRGRMMIFTGYIELG